MSHLSRHDVFDGYVVQTLPHPELLIEWGRGRYNPTTGGVGFPVYNNLTAFKLAEADITFLAFYGTLEKDNLITDLFFEFLRQLLVKLHLTTPDLLKFVLVVFPIEGLVLDALQWMLSQHFIEVLPDGQISFKEYLTTLGNSLQIISIFAFTFTLSGTLVATALVNHQQNLGKFFEGDGFCDSLRPQRMGLVGGVLSFFVQRRVSCDEAVCHQELNKLLTALLIVLQPTACLACLPAHQVRRYGNALAVQFIDLAS